MAGDPIAGLGQSRSSARFLSNEDVSLDEVAKVLLKYAGLIASDMGENLRAPTQKSSEGSNATGNLESSIEVGPVKYFGNSYVVEISMLDYWKFVNYGTRGGRKMPPVEAIKKWIIAKKLRLDDGGLTKKGYKREGTLISQSKKTKVLGGAKVSLLDYVAYKIARKIGRVGTQGTFFVNRAVDNNMKSFSEDLAKALGKDIKNNLEG